MKNQDTHRRLEATAKRHISQDRRLHSVLAPYYSDAAQRRRFIARCLRKLKTRRMLLRLQWYVELSEYIQSARDGRPALPLVFLMAMAEGVTQSTLTAATKKSQSVEVIQKFFKKIDVADHRALGQRIRRAGFGPNTPMLRFSSIVKILWNVRNDAAHGIDFWTFGLPDQKLTVDRYYSLITFGRLGKRKRPKKVSLSINMPYSELKSIFIRTALNHIRSEL